MDSESETIFKILSEIDQDERRYRKDLAKNQKGRKLAPWFLGCTVIIGAILILGILFIWLAPTMASEAVGGPEWLRLALTLTILLFGYSLCLQPLYQVAVNMRSIVNAIHNPLKLLLGNAKVSLDADFHHFPKLMTCSLHSLENVSLEIKAERDFFERRIGLLVGAVHKAGMLPGVVAAVVFLLDRTADMPAWIRVIIYSLPAMYLMGGYGHFLIMQLDRKTRLLELVIARKKEPSGGSGILVEK